jgi:hypothetical protein
MNRCELRLSDSDHEMLEMLDLKWSPGSRSGRETSRDDNRPPEMITLLRVDHFLISSTLIDVFVASTCIIGITLRTLQHRRLQS